MSLNVLEMLYEQVNCIPDAMAIADGETTLSYLELDQRSSLAAEGLARYRVKGCVVAIQMQRSADMVVALLAIFKAGATCLPLDQSYPRQRIEFMLSDSKAKLLLVDHATATSDDASGLTTIGLDSLCVLNDEKIHRSLPSRGDTDAYVLYTSGSTGEPKGVAMGHPGLASVVAWQCAQENQHWGATIQFAPISFDVSFQEIFTTLSAGGTLVIIQENSRQDPQRLLEIIRTHSVRWLFLPTAALDPLVVAAGSAPPESLAHIVVAGEQLIITPAIRRFFSLLHGCQLHNQYGPTETHVVTQYTLPDDPASWPVLPPIGSTLPHAEFLIMGANQQPVAPGEVGELWLGGTSLARAYLHRPTLTADKFRQPLSTYARMYCTGDLARSDEGVLHYCGRIDTQVKIRGHRVETAEIESHLIQHPAVAACMVTAFTEESGERILRGFVVPRECYADAGGARIRRAISPPWQAFLSNRLPGFMVPMVWITLDALPTTPNGKIDRSFLPQIPRTRPAQVKPLRAPRNELETQIAALWCDLLALSEVGVDDSFFDLGGTSITFVRLQAKLLERLAIRTRVIDLINHPTIRSFVESRTGILADSDGDAGEAAPMPAAIASASTGIALIGMACRFPGAASPAEFWNNLCIGRESISVAAPIDGDVPKQGFIRSHASLTDVGNFDSRYFGMSQREAQLLDPQHRLFLECSVEALEDAAVAWGNGPQRIGVFGGCGPSTYLLNNMMHLLSETQDRTLVGSSTGLGMLLATDKDFLTSRVSFKFNLTGPSVNVNAACATSLVAVHMACQSLLAGECDMALAGGVSVATPQSTGYQHEVGLVFSADGHCRPYDADASGTVFGNGAGVVILKRVDAAIRDGDRIYVVIEGSAVNNDGSAKAGMSAPSMHGQVDVIRRAMQAARVAPHQVSLLEGHGSATELGDMIELSALNKVFGKAPDPWCALGSVKGNIGHLGWASGMAGLIKTACALHFKKIPATLNYSSPNPILAEPGSPFSLSGELRAWPAAATRRAGVSAFGLGGVNAHLVLAESAPVPNADAPERGLFLLPISANTDRALSSVANNYVRFLNRQTDANLPDIARTAARGRRHLAVRRACVVRTVQELAQQLGAIAESGSGHGAGNCAERTSERIVGMFGGQGSEYPGIGRGLYAELDIFRCIFVQADPIFVKCTGRTGTKLLHADEPIFANIAYAQPLIFTIQMGIVAVWRAWGIEFDTVLGHSLGEFAAACTAGVFSFEDGLRLVAERGRLLASLAPDAGMLAIGASEAEVLAVLEQVGLPIDIAALNSPAQTVVSGRKEDVSGCIDLVNGAGYEIRELNIPRAGHSYLMESILPAFRVAVEKTPMQRARIDIISNVTGARHGADMCTAQYWCQQLRDTVRFADGLRCADHLGIGAALEIGGGSALCALGQANLPNQAAPWISSLRKNTGEAESMLLAAAELYEHGYDLAWGAINGNAGRPVSLPTYPFERERCWITAAPTPVLATAIPTTTSAKADSLYEVRWQEHHLHSKPAQQDGAIWLVLSDGDVGAASLVTALRAQGAFCHHAQAGPAYVRHDEYAHSLNLQSLPEVERLLSEFEQRRIAGIVHCAGWASTETGGQDGVMLPSIHAAMHSKLILLKALMAYDAMPAPALWLLTAGAQAWGRTTHAIRLDQAPILGLKRSFNLEHPCIRCRSLDLDVDDLDNFTLVARTLLTERAEDELMVVARQILVPRLIRAEARFPRSPLAKTGVYLIVGGTAGLGLECAEQLVAAGARHIVLASRRGAIAGDSTAIDALRRTGARVDLSVLDVASRGDVRALIADLHSVHHLLGIIHCAGLIDDAVIAHQDMDRFSEVLKPKAIGAWNIHLATVELEVKLNFFILFSSTTSLFGDAGQSNHAAACAFLDELSTYRQTLGLACTSVNWGPWAGAGYYANRPEQLDALQCTGFAALGVGAAKETLNTLFGGTTVRLAVLDVDWAVFLKEHGLGATAFYSHIRAELQRLTTAAQPLPSLIAAASPAQREALVLANLQRLVAASLGANAGNTASPDSDSTSFRDLGMDSLQSIRLRNAITREFDCRLESRTFNEKTCLESLLKSMLDIVLDTAWLERQKQHTVEGRRDTDIPQRKSSERGVQALSTQQRRWLKLIEGAQYGHRVVPVVFHTQFNAALFEQALRFVIERHELLRYTFPNGQIEVLSCNDAIACQGNFFVDLRALHPDQQRAALSAEIKTCRESLGAPADTVSWRIRCLDMEADRFIILIGLQHIEFDGTSLSVFVDEIRQCYANLTGRHALTMPAPVQYAQYLLAQQEYVRDHMVEDANFFAGLFAMAAPTTCLPGFPGSDTTVALPARRYTAQDSLAPWASIQAAARQIGVVPFAIVFASYARMIARVAGESLNIISIINSGRIDNRFTRTIGPFTTPLPVPIPHAIQDARHFVQACDRMVNHVTTRSLFPPSEFANVAIGFEKLPVDTYFSDVCINFLNYQKEDRSATPRVEVIEVLGPVNDGEFDPGDFDQLRRVPGLHLVADISDGMLRGNYWYHVSRFEESQIAEWAALHRDVISSMLSDLLIESGTSAHQQIKEQT